MQVHFFLSRQPMPGFMTFCLAITRMPTLKLSVIREELTEQCSSILHSYRRNCAPGTVPTQVCSLDCCLRICGVGNPLVCVVGHPRSLSQSSCLHVVRSQEQTVERLY